MTDSSPTSPPTDPTPKRAGGDGSIKETIESIVVAFILAFVFRAFIVEAFVIPTGSMAPTLLGKHVSLECPQCGFAFKSSARRTDMTEDRNTGRVEPLPYQGMRQGRDGKWYGYPLELDCPMCQHHIKEPVQRLQPGDRILVLKYIYAFQEPRRWDVVVFRNPEQPAENFIKRLVGLPSEWLRITRGNIYTSNDEGRTWQVQAKPPRVQRAVWQPVYHSKYVPLDAASRQWQTPWRPAGDDWRVNEFGRSFDHTGPAAGRLVFDFSIDPRRARDYYAYNDLFMSGSSTTAYVEDLRVAFTIDAATDGAGVAVELGTELFDVRGSIGADGAPLLQMRRAGATSWQPVGQATGAHAIAAGTPTRVALWFADHRATLWVDGDQVAEASIPLVADDADVAEDAIALKMDQLLRAAYPRVQPSVAIEVSGAEGRLTEVNLDRDLYYTDRGLGTNNSIAKIDADRFFCLGDNSPQSKDSRLWESVDPWISHDVGTIDVGFVPRRLMIGRAFFVYFPAPLRLSATGMPIVPNFGDLRFIE